MRQSGNVELESAQTGIFSHIQKWQTVWIAPDCCTLSTASSPIPGQEHLPKSLRSAGDLLGTSSCSSGKQQTQGSEPLSAAERSLLMEHNNGIAVVKEVLRIIHEVNEFEASNWASLETLEMRGFGGVTS